jgi:peptidoglycan/xylan/chitin deacetylase (PgdA/CDA1 family)
MYHALYANERELQDITPEDRPYAVSTQRFAEQLQAMRDVGLPFVDPARLGQPESMDGGVLISFDDGHGSNCEHALPALARHDARAVFFITSDFIERRPGFCSWSQLKEMSAAGMTLGSHGRSHRFLNDLSDAEAVAELRDSRDALQDGLGLAIDQVSFPGGRYRAELLPAWRGLGYRWFHSSEIGTVTRAQLSDADGTLPRLAVRQDTPTAVCLAMAQADRRWLLKARGLATAKQWLRRTAGNQFYHLLYERLHRSRA